MSSLEGGLYAFTLPQEILACLQVRSFGGQATETGPVEPVQQQVRNGLQSTSLGCATCAVVVFADLPEQREHFRSDWHRYNLKQAASSSQQQQQQQQPITEERFHGLIDNLSASISGSEGSSSDLETDEDSRSGLQRLLARQRLTNDLATDSSEERDSRGPRSPLLWFTAEPALSDTQIGIYRALFPSDAKATRDRPAAAWLSELAELQVKPHIPKPPKALRAQVAPADNAASTEPHSRSWLMIMIGGGHFAAMLVSLVPKLVYKGTKLEKEPEVFASKTFHRYTTRRKQGGAQSANDNAKGNAKSAGAGLRRYNEAALTDEVRELLHDWREDIARTEAIFLRSSRANHKVFFGYPNAVLEKRDPRIRGIPFPTKRPTLSELTRAFQELTQPRISHLTADALAALDAEYLASIAPKPKPKPVESKVTPKPVEPKLSSEEIEHRERWQRVVDMVHKGRLDALCQFIARHQAKPETNAAGVDYLHDLPGFLKESATATTLLHLASQADQPEIVRWLLYEQRADPTLAASLSQHHTHRAPQTPYELARSKETRNVFRVCYYEHPDWWNWSASDGARVPSALDSAAEQLHKAREQDRLQALRDKAQAKEAARQKEAAAEAARQAEADAETVALERAKVLATPSVKPRRLGGGPPAKLERARNNDAGLDEAARMRIERERRARAAEARLAGK
ncbi:uncharacterized protein L969DRAFT_96773 [Mixia osmundae IAM 14324]|uniref:VLRF1 domain-containing protein n=1 Tax=Mixia osmundae (strain CBS 9802 / IAM 14324 / JCM 22182 / KY 12970) TaxID=764103 RepID=G7DSZ5_MIXOS|nr:uncharacterized protein L969DRAFT_96773 [Mixia osmundae IAM 14324]KEI37216.1 hypothetical protein L969DRAFT_96773 [Mixia osmundae IAM 14324]GAA93705.1 hypothetical protein E5Q_00350 [Mixia osmundae IAM 14324]